MAYINTSQAATILGISKKTLIRWDEAGKFSPSSREKISKSRVYDEKDVLNLKKLQEHEARFQENLNEFGKVQQELNPYMNLTEWWLSDRDMDLLDKETELMEKQRELVEEFMSFEPEIKKLYKQFYMNK